MWGSQMPKRFFFFSFFFVIHIQIKPPLAAASTAGSDLWEKWFRPGSLQHSAGEEKMLVVDQPSRC